jgi:hypothetical protein
MMLLSARSLPNRWACIWLETPGWHRLPSVLPSSSEHEAQTKLCATGCGSTVA